MKIVKFNVRLLISQKLSQTISLIIMANYRAGLPIGLRLLVIDLLINVSQYPPRYYTSALCNIIIAQSLAVDAIMAESALCNITIA